jgi:hypothetical protein
MKILDKIRNSDFYKTFKQELGVGPLLFLFLYYLNKYLVNRFPHSPFFDFFSEIENSVFNMFRYFIAVWIAHLSMRVFFPCMYKIFHEKIYHTCELLSEDKQVEYAIKFILVLILSSAIIFGAKGAENPREKVLSSVVSQLGVRETSYNSGPMINKYLKVVGAPPKSPWCGAFVGANLTWQGIKNPNSAWSPDYAQPKDIIWKPKGFKNTSPLACDVVTYYFPSLKRVGHVGFFEKIDKSGYYITIEGNTNEAGGREGDGVYRKKRHAYQIHAITRYIE